MADDKGDEVLVEQLLARRHRVTRQELRELVRAARSMGGEFVQVSRSGADEPEAWRGTIWFRRPRPKLGSMLDVLIERGWVIEVFPYGVPVIDQVRVDVRNQAFGAG